MAKTGLPRFSAEADLGRFTQRELSTSGLLNNLSMRHLKTFLEVARAGTLTKAASRLGYAQSSVTVHVRELERCLGTRLFHRHPQGVRLTAEGESVREYTEQLFDIIEQMVTTLRPTEQDRVVERAVIDSSAVLAALS